MILGRLFDKIRDNKGALFGGAMIGLFCAPPIVALISLAIPVITVAVFLSLVIGGPVIGMISGSLIALAISKGVNELRSKAKPATVPANSSQALLAASSTMASYGASHNLISTTLSSNPVPQLVVSTNFDARQENANEEVISAPTSISDNDVDLDYELGAGQYAPGRHYENGMPNSSNKSSRI